MNKVITIAREFGSGGREIGKRVAEILQIPYYDSEIVTQIAQRTQLAEEYVNQILEKKPIMHFPITIGRSFYPAVNQTALQNMTIYIEQSNILLELAETSDCVIVGRCADYVLSKFCPLRIFIYADMEFKINRCREKAPEQERLTDKQMRQHITGIDHGRAGYYKFVTGQQWNDMKNYDMCINTTYYPIKDLAHIVAQLYDRPQGVSQ